MGSMNRFRLYFCIWFGAMLFAQFSNAQDIRKSTPYPKVSLSTEIDRIASYAITRRVLKHGSFEDAAKKEGWIWGPGVLMFGLTKAHTVTQNPEILAFQRSWIHSHYEKGIKLYHPDHITPAAVVGELLIRGDLEPKYTPILDQSYVWLMKGAREVRGCKGEDDRRVRRALSWKGRTWLDDLFMSGTFMTRYASVKNKPEINQLVLAQFLAHIDLLQCHAEGSHLLNHGQYLTPGGKRWMPSGKVAWARANGWFVASMVDFLEHLPKDDPGHPVLLEHFRQIVAEFPACQQPSGLFPTVLDRPKSYGEVAATALITYAVACGLKNGWLTEDRYYGLVRKGVGGILDQIDPVGQVGGTSAGTPVMPLAGMYRTIKVGTYPWGEGATLMALSEVSTLLSKQKGPFPMESEAFLLVTTYSP